MTDFVWEPTAEYLSAANATRLMKRLGIDDYHELVARSADNPEWIWTAVVEDLGIEFFTPFERVLDDSRGPAWPRWSSPETMTMSSGGCRRGRSRRRGPAPPR